jgi:hypothetical protein
VIRSSLAGDEDCGAGGAARGWVRIMIVSIHDANNTLRPLFIQVVVIGSTHVTYCARSLLTCSTHLTCQHSYMFFALTSFRSTVLKGNGTYNHARQ